MLTTTIYTILKGRQVGVDKFGNRYYEEKFWFAQPNNRHARRWVLYRGIADGSKSAAEWQGWLHYTTDQLPTDKVREPYKWEQDHVPNMTGTKRAYSPSVNHKAKAYEPWTPN